MGEAAPCRPPHSPAFHADPRPYVPSPRCRPRRVRLGRLRQLQQQLQRLRRRRHPVLTATAAGNAFRSACVSGQFTSGTLAIAGLDNIDGSAGATQRQININVPSTSVGTVNVSATGLGAIVSYADVDLANPAAGTYAGISGSVTIDALSATGAEGSFTYTARNNGAQTVDATNGSFDITF